MVLLVLSLAKSIFVVKLLHHSHEEVKEMSISACLLAKYGSTEQSFSESLFTSVRTLDDMDHSGGVEQETDTCIALLTINMFEIYIYLHIKM